MIAIEMDASYKNKVNLKSEIANATSTCKNCKVSTYILNL